MITLKYNGKTYSNFESINELINAGIPEGVILKEIKKSLLKKIKIEAHKKLSKTDWVVVKCIELGLNPSDKYPKIIKQRQAIRDWSNQKEEEINNINTIDDLLKLDIKL